MVRYPVERTEYCKTVGKTRVDNIAEILENLSFDVITRETEFHNVDVWVFKDGTLVLVIEVLNWGRNVYMDYIRTRRIIRNFSHPYHHNARKLLVFSFWKNIENQLNYFDGLDIDFLEIGFQTQPVPYYVFYLNRGLASDKKPNTSITKEIVRRKLTAYLTQKNLI